MGRLFWKFFFFFFLAQLTAVVGVGVTIWSQGRAHDASQSSGIEYSPPARALVEAAASTLQFGGETALKNLLEGWQQRPMPQVHAVDSQGRELMQRAYTQAALDAADKHASSHITHAYAKRVRLTSGLEYLLFVPESGRQPHAAGMPPPKSPHMFPFKTLIAGVLASLVFAAMLAWYFSKPIKQLRNAFNQASAGKLDVRLGASMGLRKDELSDLGHDFDTMATRLGALIQGQTHLLHHVSHELRSPLARIQMAIGLARQSPEKVENSLSRIQLESERMDKLVGELLQLSRLESGVMRLHKEKVAFNEVLGDVLQDAGFEADGKGIAIRLHAPSRFTLMGEAELLHRAIENIVRNAIKYSPEGSEIMVELRADMETGRMLLSVCDQGPGVPQADMEAIFQPFVRSGAQNGDGHGVGLAIAKQVMEAHGGEIRARNRTTGGLCIEIALPYLATWVSNATSEQ